jgi:hypothetical protein
MNVVVGKNYRVQNIQLSKIACCQLSRQSVYVGVPVGAATWALETTGADVGA